MTPFARRVLRVVARIPVGRVATYGDIAGAAGRPGQFADGIMQVEQGGVRQLPHVVEPRLGPRPFLARDASLPGRANQTADERQQRHRAGDDHGAVTLHELGRAIGERAGARDYRQAGEMTPHVLRELVDRRIAAPRLLAQRLEDDVVQIAGQPAP